MNTYDDGFRYGFMRGRANAQIERDREAERDAALRKPFPGNPPELMKPTKCKVLKPFGLAGGKVAEVDQVVELARHDALSMAAIGRVQLLKE